MVASREEWSAQQQILTTLTKMAAEAERRATKYWEAKDDLDQYLQKVLELPPNERPTGSAMAKVVGRDRRRLYQINKLGKDLGFSAPKRPK
jgi:hypothetical protein